MTALGWVEAQASQVPLFAEEGGVFGACRLQGWHCTRPMEGRSGEEVTPASSDNLKTLWSFLGLALYYSRFVPGFSVVASPLFTLTRKDAPFLWTEACEEAFGS